MLLELVIAYLMNASHPIMGKDFRFLAFTLVSRYSFGERIIRISHVHSFKAYFTVNEKVKSHGIAIPEPML